MTQSTEQERATREDFEHWSKSTNQGYDLTRNQSGRMPTYECVKTEHAWRGFFHGWQAARRAPAAPVPQEQTPLTIDEIGTCWQQMGSGFDKYEKFARAIERAHGIGATNGQ